MYLYKDQANKLLLEMGGELLSELKGKSDFMLSLIESDDWSMIIKSHALLESLVTELIVSRTEEPKLKALLERLPLSDDQIGKIKIAKDYDLLSSSERAFIRRFAVLRNQLVHKFENLDFDLVTCVQGLDTNQKKSWRNAFTWYEHGKNVENSWSDATISNPKLAVWLSVYMFVSLTAVKIYELKGRSKIRATAEQTVKDLMSKSV